MSKFNGVGNPPEDDLLGVKTPQRYTVKPDHFVF